LIHGWVKHREVLNPRFKDTRRKIRFVGRYGCPWEVLDAVQSARKEVRTKKIARELNVIREKWKNVS
jgi:hypothetical protein